jgi:hypothetical protein
MRVILVILIGIIFAGIFVVFSFRFSSFGYVTYSSCSSLCSTYASYASCAADPAGNPTVCQDCLVHSYCSNQWDESVACAPYCNRYATYELCAAMEATDVFCDFCNQLSLCSGWEDISTGSATVSSSTSHAAAKDYQLVDSYVADSEAFVREAVKKQSDVYSRAELSTDDLTHILENLTVATSITELRKADILRLLAEYPEDVLLKQASSVFEINLATLRTVISSLEVYTALSPESRAVLAYRFSGWQGEYSARILRDSARVSSLFERDVVLPMAAELTVSSDLRTTSAIDFCDYSLAPAVFFDAVNPGGFGVDARTGRLCKLSERSLRLFQVSQDTRAPDREVYSFYVGRQLNGTYSTSPASRSTETLLLSVDGATSRYDLTISPFRDRYSFEQLVTSLLVDVLPAEETLLTDSIPDAPPIPWFLWGTLVVLFVVLFTFSSIVSLTRSLFHRSNLEV